MLRCDLLEAGHPYLLQRNGRGIGCVCGTSRGAARLEVDYSEIEEQYKPHLLQCLQRDFARDGDYDLLAWRNGRSVSFP